jgi:hypothetical protein
LVVLALSIAATRLPSRCGAATQLGFSERFQLLPPVLEDDLNRRGLFWVFLTRSRFEAVAPDTGRMPGLAELLIREALY